MKRIFKATMVGVMAGALAGAPMYPAQNQAIGVVLDTDGAHIRETNLTAGASLFNGDVVSTESDGHAQLRVRQSRFALIGESYGAFFPGANGAVAELRHGTMIVALNSAAETFEIFASDVRIVPKSERPIQHRSP